MPFAFVLDIQGPAFLGPKLEYRVLCQASRAPLAERAAVNRQVLGSIPSGGAIFFLFKPCPQTNVIGRPNLGPKKHPGVAQW